MRDGSSRASASARRHGQRRAGAVGMRIGGAIGVTRRAEPSGLGVDPRAAPPRVLPLFEDQHARALAHDEPVASGVEGAARRGGIVVSRRQRAQQAERRQPHRIQLRVRAAGDDGVGAATTDPAHRIADGLRAAGAGGHDADRRTPETVARGDARRNRSRRPSRRRVRQHPAQQLRRQQRASRSGRRRAPRPPRTPRTPPGDRSGPSRPRRRRQSGRDRALDDSRQESFSATAAAQPAKRSMRPRAAQSSCGSPDRSPSSISAAIRDGKLRRVEPRDPANR